VYSLLLLSKSVSSARGSVELRHKIQSDGTKQGQFFLPKMEEQDREHAARKLFAGGQWRAEADAGQKVGGLQDAPNHTSAAPVELEARRPMKW
jgi:predicted RecA/RadA family phage recombinase